MTEMRLLKLDPFKSTLGRLTFLCVEMPNKETPYFRVHYAINGEEQELAHVIDVHKRIFLDELEYGSHEESMNLAEQITQQIAYELSTRKARSFG